MFCACNYFYLNPATSLAKFDFDAVFLPNNVYIWPSWVLVSSENDLITCHQYISSSAVCYTILNKSESETSWKSCEF